MNGEPFLTFGNGFKLVFAGILGILWWDVRKVGKLRQNIMNGIEGKYLTRDKHTDLCKIASLEMKRHVSNEINTAKDAIIEAIKDNGKGD